MHLEGPVASGPGPLPSIKSQRLNVWFDSVKESFSRWEGCISNVERASTAAFNLGSNAMTPELAKVELFKPRSCGFPEGLLAQPFYGWVGVADESKARFNGLRLKA
jgi:hypothetical protein